MYMKMKIENLKLKWKSLLFGFISSACTTLCNTSHDVGLFYVTVCTSVSLSTATALLFHYFFTCPADAPWLFSFHSRSCHSHLLSSHLISLTWASPPISQPVLRPLISHPLRISPKILCSFVSFPELLCFSLGFWFCFWAFCHLELSLPTSLPVICLPVICLHACLSAYLYLPVSYFRLIKHWSHTATWFVCILLQSCISWALTSQHHCTAPGIFYFLFWLFNLDNIYFILFKITFIIITFTLWCVVYVSNLKLHCIAEAAIAGQFNCECQTESQRHTSFYLLSYKGYHMRCGPDRSCE